ncbi:MAG: FxsA family protein [Proteobacteria bacterium]|nr:FxsA family protein [Pseudomonadota bacterium]
MIGLLVLAIVIVLIWIEVIVFGIVGGAIGVLPTVIGVFISAILGFQLIRYRMMRMVAGGAIGQPPHEIMPQVLSVVFG